MESSMNLVRPLYLAAVIFLLHPSMALAELPGIKVIVSNISPSEGKVEVSLFNSSDSFMKEPYLQQSGPPDENGRFETEFVGLPEGEFAVVVVHDANNNGKLDAGFLGIGGESFGYSNNASPWFSRPDFDEVKVTVDVPGTLIEINLD